MGLEYEACAVIGVKIVLKSDIQTITVRGCSHPEVKGAKFCPECGRPMWQSTQEKILDPYTDLYEPLCRVFQGSLYHVYWNSEENEMLIGFGASTSYASKSLVIPLMDDIYQTLQDALQPLGYWTEDVEESFGFHVALACS